MQSYKPEALKVCHALAQSFGYRGPRIPSCLYKSYRVRAVYDHIYFRTPTETFSEFKYQHLKFILEKTWWMHQARQPPEKRHPIMQYAFAYREEAERRIPANHQNGEVFTGPLTNAIFELLLLADDVLRLTAGGAGIPESVLKRLRGFPEYQSARSELFVAGLLLRAGFEIKWLDPNLKGGEFEARDPGTGEVFSVEVKSRYRPGILNHPGQPESEESLQAGLYNLFERALDQCRSTTANAIFLDVNLPTVRDPVNDWPYWGTVNEFIESMPRRIDKKRSFNVFFFYIIANGWHWRPTDAMERPPVAHGFISPCNHLISNPNTLARLLAATTYPPRLPEGLYE